MGNPSVIGDVKPNTSLLSAVFEYDNVADGFNNYGDVADTAVATVAKVAELLTLMMMLKKMQMLMMQMLMMQMQLMKGREWRTLWSALPCF